MKLPQCDKTVKESVKGRRGKKTEDLLHVRFSIRSGKGDGQTSH